MGYIEELMDKANSSMTENDFYSAVSFLDEIIKVDPNNTDAFSAKATCMYFLSNFEEAFEMFTQVLKLKPSDPDVYFGIGICLEDLKEYNRAIIYFNKILEMDINNIYAHSHKANCLFLKGDYED